MIDNTHSQKKRIIFILVGLLFLAFIIDNVIPAHAEARRQATVTPTPTSIPTTCTSWNLASDFRISANHENPNRDSCNNLGIWEFMGSGGFSHVPANYYLLPNFTPNGYGIIGNNLYDTGSQFPHISFNASGAAIISGAITISVNTIDVHPAPGEMAVIAWHSLANGYISISGLVSDNSPACGDGILWYIDKNSTTVASGGYGNGGSQTFAGGTGGAGLSALSVASGDVVYLAIHPNGDYICDDTLVDLTISVTSGPTPTITLTPTITKTPTITLTPTITYTPSYTPTVTRTPTITRTPTKTGTPTRTPTRTKTPTVTRTPTKTLTPTRTLTPTITLTPSYTSTITSTPTNTPTPNSNGSGTCWSSQESWGDYIVYYSIDRNTIPVSFGWDTSIYSSAQTWNSVNPSHFIFVYSTDSTNTVRYEVPNNQNNLAASAPPPSSGPITSGYTLLNPNMSWDVNNTPLSGNPNNNGSTTTYNVQNAVTHELGHWLFLNDINDSSCDHVTMDHDIGFGELIKIDLSAADENAINWQYP